MAKLIFVAVGTSALFGKQTNWKKSSSDMEWQTEEALIKALEEEIRKGQNKEYNHQKKQSLASLKRALERYYKNNERGLDTLSTELSSLLAMKKEPSIGQIIKGDRIVLLPSDTMDGKLCAEVNEEIMREEIKINGQVKKEGWISVQIRPIEKYKVMPSEPCEDIANIFLDNALSDLQKKVNDEIDTFRNTDVDRKCYFNITGGYKALIPFATVLVANHDMAALVYLYEKGNRLIIIDDAYLKSRINDPKQDLRLPSGERAI